MVAYFEPKQYTLKQFFKIFPIFILINFLLRTLQLKDYSIFFWPWKYEITTSKCKILLQNWRDFPLPPLPAQLSQKVKFTFSNVAYRATVYKTGLPTVFLLITRAVYCIRVEVDIAWYNGVKANLKWHWNCHKISWYLKLYLKYSILF